MKGYLERRIFPVIKYTILILLSISILYPIAWVIMGSLKTPNELALHPWSIPHTLQFKVFKDVLINYKLQWNLLNSIVVSISTVLIVSILSVLAAYGITRMKWKLSKLTLGFFLLGLLIPVHATLIPLYTMLQGWREVIDPRIVLLIPYVAFGLPTSIFILSGYFQSIPRELEEAAVLDGCSIIGAFFRVILPITKPALATAAVFAFIGTWNELLFALVFLQNQDVQTIPVALLQFTGTYTTNWSAVLASISVTIIPSILFYVILQNKIIEGTTAGAVKN